MREDVTYPLATAADDMDRVIAAGDPPYNARCDGVFCSPPPLAGCLRAAPRSLSELHGTCGRQAGETRADRNPQPQQFSPDFSVLIENPDCAPLEADATAKLRGDPLRNSRGTGTMEVAGWRATCSISRRGPSTNASKVLVIRDSPETWKIDVRGFTDTVIALSSAARGQENRQTVTWPDGGIWAASHSSRHGAATLMCISTGQSVWRVPTIAGCPATGG